MSDQVVCPVCGSKNGECCSSLDGNHHSSCECSMCKKNLVGSKPAMQIHVLSSYTPDRSDPDYAAGEEKILGVFSSEEEVEEYLDYLCDLPENKDTAFFSKPYELGALKVPFPYDDNNQGH